MLRKTVSIQPSISLYSARSEKRLMLHKESLFSLGVFRFLAV